MGAAVNVPAPADVEKGIATDIVKRGLLIAPAVVLVAGLAFGVGGALSAGYAVLIVLVNFLLSAAVLSWAARVSPTTLMAAALGGFLGRMILVTIAVYAVHKASWVHMSLLAVTVLVTHLGLLFWETRYVSASLAYPGLKPTRGEASH